MKNKVLTVIISGILATCFFTEQPVLAEETLSETMKNKITILDVEPMADKIEWRYKVIDGVLYKRKYNVSNQCWVGNWIKVV